MSRIRLTLVAVAAVAMLAVPSTGTTASEATMLTGTVGPGFTITLKKGGVKVRTLKAGSYTIRVSDRSNAHDFRLKGAMRKTITTVAFRGTKTVTMNLRKGSYTYYCAPHASAMKGTFRVV
jgi:plastocyanin